MRLFLSNLALSSLLKVKVEERKILRIITVIWGNGVHFRLEIWCSSPSREAIIPKSLSPKWYKQNQTNNQTIEHVSRVMTE